MPDGIGNSLVLILRMLIEIFPERSYDLSKADKCY